MSALALTTGRAAAQGSESSRCAEAYERGQELRKEGKLTAARARFLVCSAAACPTVARKDCTQWYAEVEQTMPTIVAAAKESTGADVLDATLSIDGVVVARRLDGRPIAVDPGPHEIKVALASGRSKSTQVVVQQGVRDRLVSVTLDPAAGSGPSDGAQPHDGGSIVPAVVFGGVAVIAGVLAIGLQLSAESERQSLYETCGKRMACDRSQKDPIDGKVLGARISLGIGIVALGAATYFFFTRSPSRAANALASPVLRF